MLAGKDIEQLISRVGLKDREAFQALYQHTSAKLFGITLRILGNRIDAEDALQEVYIKIWNKAESFDVGRAGGMAWLATIARNQAIDLLRSRKPNEDIDNHPEIVDQKPDPESVAQTKDESNRLAKCLEELEDIKGDMVRDIYLGGWTYQKAADELGIPLNTAKTWIRRSLIALRRCLDR